jgi:HSP20 family protein
MSENFRRLEQLQREMSSIALELLRGEFAPSGGSPHWRPAINAYRCRDRFTICVDLAGTTKEAIQILVERRRLTLRGNRPSLEPGGDCPGQGVLAMEIDHGPFERILDLPSEVDPDRTTAEYRQGVLWIELPLLPSA